MTDKIRVEEQDIKKKKKKIKVVSTRTESCVTSESQMSLIFLTFPHSQTNGQQASNRFVVESMPKIYSNVLRTSLIP